MDDTSSGPRARAYSVAQSAPHQILVCEACTHEGKARKPGFALLKNLRAAIASAGFDDDFELPGTACLAGCVTALGKPCVPGWRATDKAGFLFGDIDANLQLHELVAFVTARALQANRWTGGPALPPRLSDTSAARIPAAMILPREGAIH